MPQPIENQGTSRITGKPKMTRSEAARHAANVRYGKEQPFAARLEAIRAARKQRKAKGKAKGGKGKAAKPQVTPEQRLAARQAEKQANTDKTLTAVGMGDEAASTLLSLAAGEGGGGDDFGLIKQGLIEKDTQGNLRLSASGREFVNAAERGDLGAARDAMSRGGDNVARSGERATAKQQRDTERAQKESEREKAKAEKVAARAEKEKAQAKEKTKAGSSGGKEQAADKPDKEQQRAQEKTDNRLSVQGALEQSPNRSLNPTAFSALTAFADGVDADPAVLDALATATGLVEKDSSGGHRLTTEGRAYVRAADKGDVRGAGDAMSRAMDRMTPDATGSPRSDDAPEGEASPDVSPEQRVKDDTRRAARARRRAHTAKNQSKKAIDMAKLTIVLDTLSNAVDVLTAEGETEDAEIKAGRRNNMTDQSTLDQGYELAEQLCAIFESLGANTGMDDAETEGGGVELVEGKAQRTFGGLERDDVPDSEFAGPHRSYPIRTAQDVKDAARLIGKADDPEAVKRKIIAIARRKGFEDAIPEAWIAAKKDADDLTEMVFGGEIKALDGDHVRGLAIRFGSEDEPDASQMRDFFTKSTDYWIDRIGPNRPMLYHHAMEENTADDPVIGTWNKAVVTDEGVWLEGELSKSFKYRTAIKELIRRGVLHISTDSAPHLVRRAVKSTGAHEVTRWPILCASLTISPAEHRLPAVSLKSLMDELETGTDLDVKAIELELIAIETEYAAIASMAV